MFMGRYQNSIDVKSRMVIPSKYRDELGYRCVLTSGIDRCLYVYPISQWEVFMDKLKVLPTADPKARAFVRHFYSNAVECDVDKQGRIVVPQELREYANIKKELTTVGVMDKIEIWAKEEWDSSETTEMSQLDFAEKMVEYGI